MTSVRTRFNHQRNVTRSIVMATAFAALGTTTTTTHALAPVLPNTTKPGSTSLVPKATAHDRPPRVETRLYSSNSGDEGGFFKSLAKKVLPKKWTQTKEEQRADLVRKQRQDEVGGSLDEMLKGAPLGIRMLGKMVKPIVKGMVGSLAETMQEQQRTIQEVVEDVRHSLAADSAVRSELGDPIQVASPISQSSSMTSINGKTQTRIELILPVSGSRGSGMARVSATEAGIASVQFEANGRSMNVVAKSVIDIDDNVSSGSSFQRSSVPKPKRGGKDDIIEAEIIDKDSK